MYVFQPMFKFFPAVGENRPAGAWLKGWDGRSG
jgi:hypothetical protein